MTNPEDANVRCTNGHTIPVGFETVPGQKKCPVCGAAGRVVRMSKTVSAMVTVVSRHAP